jgi:hypothetical protein
MVYHHFPCHPSNAKLVCDMPAISLQKFDLIMLEEVMVLFDMGYFIKKFVHKIILLYFKLELQLSFSKDEIKLEGKGDICFLCKK